MRAHRPSSTQIRILALLLLAGLPGVAGADASSLRDDGPVAVGHLNPDSDSIGAAIGAELLFGAKPVLLLPALSVNCGLARREPVARLPRQPRSPR